MKSLFEHIPGNELVKDYLVNMVQKQAVGNSLLFSGPDDAQKDLFALSLAKILMGEQAHSKIDTDTHPDLHIYRPEGKIGMHSIASMRQFCEEVYLPPYESSWKVFVIQDAERMLSYSANALLKTFEEPALDSVIILLTAQPNLLLPTILSRCRIVRFQGVTKKKLIDNSLRQAVLNLLARGKVGTYTELSSSAAQLADLIQESQKTEEETHQSEIKKNSLDQMNPHQRQALEKELEGAMTMSLHKHAKTLFQDILSWYRDLHLIHAKGRKELIQNVDFYEQLVLIYQKGGLLPLETVEKSVKQAIMSLERSTALNLCLERLLLELGLINP